MNEDRIFETGAKRDNADGKGRMDLIPWQAVIELSKHCERGAKHYGENNVRMGIPFHSLSDSGARHLAKWIAGVTDEPTHLVAACWNLMWLLEETLTRPELNDMPWASEQLWEQLSSAIERDKQADIDKAIAEAGEETQKEG